MKVRVPANSETFPALEETDGLGPELACCRGLVLPPNVDSFP